MDLLTVIGGAVGLGKSVVDKLPDPDPDRADRREAEGTIRRWWRNAVAAARGHLRARGRMRAAEERLERLNVDVDDLRGDLHDALDTKRPSGRSSR